MSNELRQCAVCEYAPVVDGEKGAQTRARRTCGPYWLCSFDCHKQFHAIGVDAPDLDAVTTECEEKARA